jgi:putative ABC transport system substrate-binding protein
LAQPGGNATGLWRWNTAWAAKWLELLKEITPGVTRVTLVMADGIEIQLGGA